jgi:GrpB-like predicted nucleotidyltransferase (UPF0157 family)
VERFESEARQLREALGGAVEVQHVGSTSVPGLAGKPTIDIAVAVPQTPLSAEAVARLETLGFENAAADSRPGEHRFRKGGAVPREVIVHVVPAGSPQWGDLIGFRDALRPDPRLAAEYEALKREKLAELGTWYSGRDKEAFIRAVLERSPWSS